MLEFIRTIINALKNYVDSKISKSKSDWNQNDKSADNYIKNRPFYEKNEEVLLVNSFTLEDYNNEDVEIPKCTFVVGNTYKVIWNGEVYDNLVCYFDEYNIIASSNNGCPFYIDDDGGDALYIESDNEDEVWTVSIIEYQKELKKIDKKYLPDDIGGKPDWNQNDETATDYIKNKPFGTEIGKKYLIEEQTITLDSYGHGNCTPIQGWYAYLPVGTPYEIEFDGESYIGTVYEDGDACTRTDFTTSSGVKVYFYELNGISSSSELAGEHTIKLSVISEVVKQIDEKFIPDEVRVESTSYNISKEEQSQARHNIGISEHNFPELIITDKVTGYRYMISMINKKIVYESLCDGSIYVSQMPTRTIYGANDTINTDDGMIIAAVCEDGSTKEIVNYTSVINSDGIVTITYIENGKEYTTTFTVEIIEGLEDFYYTENGDRTVTITGWKGTLNGEPSTEMVFPNDSRVIL